MGESQRILYHSITRRDGLVFCSWNNSIPAIIHPSFAAASSFLPLAPSVFFPPLNSQPSLPVRVFVSIFPASRKNCNCIKDAPRRAGTLPPRVPWSRANLPAISIYLLIDSLQWNLASRVDDIRRFTPRTRVICYRADAFTRGIFAADCRYFKVVEKTIAISFFISIEASNAIFCPRWQSDILNCNFLVTLVFLREKSLR